MPIKDIDFTSAQGMKRTLDGQIKSLVDSEEERDVSDLNVCEKTKKVGSRSTEAHLALLFENLSVTGTKPGLLSVVPAYSEQFVPTSANKDFPLPLTSLKNSQYVKMKYHELLKECQSVSLSVTDKMAENVEAAMLQGTRVNLSCGINTEQVESLHQE